MTDKKIAENEALEKLEAALQSVEHEGEWVLVRSYSKRERSVKANIETRIANLNLGDSIYEVIIPEETVVQIKDGAKKKVVRSRIPGYLLVRMDTYNKDAVAELRKTNGVVDYAGGTHSPIPLTREEVVKILGPIVTRTATNEITVDDLNPALTQGRNLSGANVEVGFVVGETVVVTSGPFEHMDATISDIDIVHERVWVLLSLLGRETPVELDLKQIAKQKI
jgi:transcriptional antiterminator NusG